MKEVFGEAIRIVNGRGSPNKKDNLLRALFGRSFRGYDFYSSKDFQAIAQYAFLTIEQRVHALSLEHASIDYWTFSFTPFYRRFAESIYDARAMAKLMSVHGKYSFECGAEIDDWEPVSEDRYEPVGRRVIPGTPEELLQQNRGDEGLALILQRPQFSAECRRDRVNFSVAPGIVGNKRNKYGINEQLSAADNTFMELYGREMSRRHKSISSYLLKGALPTREQKKS